MFKKMPEIFRRKLFLRVLGCLGLILMIFGPKLIWGRSIELDEAAFTTEYYKNLVDVSKILFGFWLANVFLLRYKSSVFKNHYSNQWKFELTSLEILVKKLADSFPGDTPLSSSAKFLAQLGDDIRNAQIHLTFLADLILNASPEYDIGALRAFANDYKENLDANTKFIVSAFNKREIIPRRPPSDELRKNVSDLFEGIRAQLARIE